MHIEKCKTLSDSALTPHKLKVRSYQSSYFGIKQSRSEAKQSKVKQKLSKSEAKHRFEQKLLDLGCSCSPHVFDLSTFQIWTSQNLYQFCKPRPIRTDLSSFQSSLAAMMARQGLQKMPVVRKANRTGRRVFQRPQAPQALMAGMHIC